MNRTTMFLPAVFLAILASPASAAPGDPCTPARAGMHVAAQPEAWQQAVEALIASSATPGQPWSCVGGEVDVEVGASSTMLTVIDAQGHAITREVVSPDEVAPLGEALLSKPLEEPAPVQPPPTEPQPEPVATRPRDPRLLLAATVGPRYAGPSHLIWGSFQAFAAVPFRPLGGGIWLRYDNFATVLDKPVPPMSELCVGAAGFFSVSLGRIEIRPMLRPSLAIVTQRIAIDVPDDGPMFPGPGPQQHQTERIYRNETNLDFRVGAEAQVVIGLTKKLRGVIGFDVEVSPGQLASTSETHRSGEFQARLPAYTMGLGLGLEVAIP